MGLFKDRLERLAKANEKARGDELRAMTTERAAQVLEGLISCPAVPPKPDPHPEDHPVSLGRRIRQPHA